MATNFEILKNCLNGGNNNEAANILAELCTAFRDCNSYSSCIKRILHCPVVNFTRCEQCF